MELERKKTLQLKVMQPKWKSLKDLSSRLKNLQRITFVNRYGKILDLLDVEVQIGALTALAQFYDPPLRCFTFQDFQLAPTLEEFEQILGYPLKESKPYLYMGHYPALNTVATSLKIDVRELASKKESKGGVDGFSRKYFEKRADFLAKNGEWDGFMDVLALIIYGIILFPNIEDFIDFAAIDVFLAYMHNKRNPLPAILADTYYTLTVRHEKKRRVILCCLPTLYIWFTTHMFKGRAHMEAKSNREWAQSIVNLNERSILWYFRDLERINMICHCGEFPNVPLMGTKGCINYNPVLASRQFGYPMKNRLTEESMSPFICELNQNLEMLNKVRHSWDQVVRGGKELRSKCCIAHESYNQWLKERVQRIKLPFRSATPTVEDIPTQCLNSLEGNETFKEMFAKSEEDRKRLKKELMEARQECRVIKREKAQKQLSLEMATKRARVEKACRLRTQSCLRGANEELKLRRQERDKALVKAGEWKEAWKESKIAERSVKRQLESLKQQLKEVVVEYESRVGVEKQLKEELLSEHQVALEDKNEHINYLIDQIKELNKSIDSYEGERRLWACNFMDRALQIKQMLNEASHLLQRAEGMTYPLPTPVEIYEFLDYCKDMISQMKNMASCVS